MPSPNRIKDYVKDAFYHIYNRGTGKMDIFLESKDYIVLMHYLKIILSPIEFLEQELSVANEQLGARSKQFKRLMRAINQSRKEPLFQNLELLSFALMPNHLHLLVYQKTERAIETLMRRLGTAYSSGYFTKKYEYTGTIFGSAYKASHLYYDPELQALATARYIERSCVELLNRSSRSADSPRNQFTSIENYPFSSLRYYQVEESGRGGKVPVWLNTRRLFGIFNKIKEKPNGIMEDRVAKHQSYTDFVKSIDDFTPEDVRLGHLASLF